MDHCPKYRMVHIKRNGHGQGRPEGDTCFDNFAAIVMKYLSHAILDPSKRKQLPKLKTP